MTATWLKLVRLAGPSRAPLVSIAALILATVVIDAARPWPLKWLVDHVLKPGGPAGWWESNLDIRPDRWTLVVVLVTATVVFFLLGQSARIALNYIQSGFGSRITYNLAWNLFDHLQRLSLLFHSRRPAADLLRRVTTDSTCIRDLFLGVLIPAATSLAMLAVMFGIMWRLDRTLTLIALSVAVPLGVLIKLCYAPMSRHASEQQERQSEMMVDAERVLSAIPVVQSFRREAREDERFDRSSRAALRAYARVIWAQLQFKLGTGAVTAAGTAVVMIVGGLHVLDGSLTLGGLLVFLAYLSSLYTPLETLAYLSSALAAAAAGARRVAAVLESDERVHERADAIPLPAPVGGSAQSLAFEQVTFGYDRDRPPVLRGVTLRVRAGEALAIIGRSGAGKSTLASLVPRLMDPWEGRLLLDGHDLCALQLSSLRQRVAVVPQEPLLLPISIAENIAYGRADATPEQIAAAASQAGALEFIRQLPQGMQTVLGERGCTLSAGQRQRLAIARALLKEATILVLDEPTAALDAGMERSVMAAVERLKGSRTILLIAHRLSTARCADRVAVIEAGQVVREGTPDEVLGSSHADAWFDLPQKSVEGGVAVGTT